MCRVRMAPVSKVNDPMTIGMSERSVAMNVHSATYPYCFNRYLDRPQQRVIGLFRIWFDGGLPNVFGKKPNPVLGGQAKYILDNKQDLACLKAPQDTDFLSRFLQQHWLVKVSRLQLWVAFSSLKCSRKECRHVSWANRLLQRA